MKKTIILWFALLPMWSMAQVVKVDVSVLSEKGSNERVGVVLQKDAETDEFYNLVVELRNHSDKVNATKAVESRKNTQSEAEILDESIAKMEDLKKRGLLSEAEFQRMKSTMTAQLKKSAEYALVVEQQAAISGSSNPSALKERIRSYCIDKRFFYSASNEVNGMVRVENRTKEGKRYQGFIDVVKAKVVIEPNRYGGFNYGTQSRSTQFTNDGYIIAHLTGKPGAEMIDRSGRVLLSGYTFLIFYNDSRILKAENAEGRWGIIDYQGNVLEPFIHSGSKSDELQRAANRIFKEKGGEIVEIW